MEMKVYRLFHHLNAKSLFSLKMVVHFYVPEHGDVP